MPSIALGKSIASDLQGILFHQLRMNFIQTVGFKTLIKKLNKLFGILPKHTLYISENSQRLSQFSNRRISLQEQTKRKKAISFYRRRFASCELVRLAENWL